MNRKIDISYYAQYLRNYLEDTNNPLASDTEFINARSELAAGEFESDCSCGLEAYQAQEFAMEVLMAGFE